jgi:hypothetical protein
MAYRAKTTQEKGRYRVFLAFYIATALSAGLLSVANAPFWFTFAVCFSLFAGGVYVMATNRGPRLGWTRRKP